MLMDMGLDLYLYSFFGMAGNAHAFLTMGATETTSLGSVTRDISLRSTGSA